MAVRKRALDVRGEPRQRVDTQLGTGRRAGRSAAVLGTVVEGLGRLVADQVADPDCPDGAVGRLKERDLERATPR